MFRGLGVITILGNAGLVAPGLRLPCPDCCPGQRRRLCARRQRRDSNDVAAHWAIYWPVAESQHGYDIRSGRCCLAHPLGLAAVVAYIDGIGGSYGGDVRARYGVKEKQTVWDHTLCAMVNDLRAHECHESRPHAGDPGKCVAGITTVDAVPGDNRTARMSFLLTVPRRVPGRSVGCWIASARRPNPGYCREIEYDQWSGPYASDDNRDERQSRASWLQLRRQQLACA